MKYKINQDILLLRDTNVRMKLASFHVMLNQWDPTVLKSDDLMNSTLVLWLKNWMLHHISAANCETGCRIFRMYFCLSLKCQPPKVPTTHKPVKCLLPWVRWCSRRCSPDYTQTHVLWSASCPSGPQARFWPAAHVCSGQSERKTSSQRLLTTREKGKGEGVWPAERKQHTEEKRSWYKNQ